MRRRHLVAGLIGLLLAGGVAVALIVAVRGKNEVHRVVQEAHRLEHRVKPTIVQLQPTRRLHAVSAAVLRRLRKKGHDDHRSPTREAARSSTFVSSATTKPTTAKSLSNSPRGNDLALFARNWFSGGYMSYTAEPSVAENAGRILETWNWDAALSSDGGRRFTFSDPDTDFPKAHKGFCCDQIAYYVPGADLWIWLLQYSEDKQGNILRLAVARGSAAFDAARLNRATFTTFDISPLDLGRPAGAWFDFNGVSSTRSNLFVSTNISNGLRYEGIVLRIPLTALSSGSAGIPAGTTYLDAGDDTVPRLVRGVDTTMYIASHLDASALRVWSWPDADRGTTYTDVSHDAYNPKKPYHCRRRPGPASDDWCEGLRDGDFKNDDTILTGWVANGRVGFAWDAGQDPRHHLPYPYVMIVELDAATLRVADQQLIWSPKYAYQDPAIVPNARGDLGGVVLRGGGTAFESCTAVIRDRFSTRSPSGWDAYTLAASNHDRSAPYAGDYLGAATAGAGANTWTGGCMTLNGGAAEGKYQRVHWFDFGRAADERH
jgi:hypothetical protein